MLAFSRFTSLCILNRKEIFLRKLILFGDSITAGATHGYPTPVFSNKVRQALGDLPVELLNRGVLGDDTIGGLARIQSDVLNNDPDLVVIFFGTNDVQVPQMTAAKFQTNLESMLHQIGPKKCILVTPGIVGPTRVEHRPLASLKEYAQVVLNVAAQFDLPVVNWFATASQHDPAELLQSDDLHYAPHAYDLLLADLAPLLRQALNTTEK